MLDLTEVVGVARLDTAALAAGGFELALEWTDAGSR